MPLPVYDLTTQASQGLRIIRLRRINAATTHDLLMEARQRGLFVLMLGDAVGCGPDRLDLLRQVIGAVCRGLGDFVPGDQDEKFRRYAMGRPVTVTDERLATTLKLLEGLPHTDRRTLTAAFAQLVGSRPVWRTVGPYVLAPAAAVPAMLALPAPLVGATPVDVLRTLALYGNSDTGEQAAFPDGAFAVFGRDAGTSSPAVLDLGPDRLTAARPPIRLGELIVLVGPAGAGKSRWAHENHPADAVISADAIRLELLGDIRVQTHGREIFERMHARARDRLARGLPAVLDATHLDARQRRAAAALAGPDHPVCYVVLDRPLPDKLRDGGWRLDVPGLIERHHAAFERRIASILAGDGQPNVSVLDLRRGA